MSNFSISSTTNKHARYNTQKIEAGYKPSANIQNRLYNFSAFHKYAMDNENYMSFGDDFICVTGTLIYKNLIGATMLSKLYGDYHSEISEIRKNSIGAYCIIIKKGNLITIFGEENYSYNIYYYIKDNDWIISNSFLDIPTISENNFEIDKYNFIEFVFNTYILDNETIFKEVKRLCGNQYISIDLTKNSADIIEIEVDWKLNINNSYQESVKKVTTNLNKVTKTVCENFGSPVLCMTGGLDSRMNFASVLGNGYLPTLLYGVGNSILTDTKDMDLTINKMYSSLFKLKLNVADWSTPTKIDESWEKYLNRYSESFLQYNASSNVLYSFEELKEPFVTFGYFGEFYRNIPWIENQTKDYFSLEEYIDEYFFKTVGFDDLLASTNIDKDKFKNNILRKLKNLCIRYGINPEKVHIDEYRYLYLEYLRVGCSIMLNLINKIRYCSYLIAEDNVYKNCPIYVSSHTGARFMLDCYETMFPKILSVPFYTHCELRSYNTKTKCLNPSNTEKYKRITSRFAKLKKFVPLKIKLWILRTFVNKDNKAFMDESRNNTILETIHKYIDNQYIIDIQFKPFIHRNYINLSMMIFALGKKKS